jgi:hypothetical protein
LQCQFAPTLRLTVRDRAPCRNGSRLGGSNMLLAEWDVVYPANLFSNPLIILAGLGIRLRCTQFRVIEGGRRGGRFDHSCLWTPPFVGREEYLQVRPRRRGEQPVSVLMLRSEWACKYPPLPQSRQVRVCSWDDGSEHRQRGDAGHPPRPRLGLCTASRLHRRRRNGGRGDDPFGTVAAVRTGR